MAKKPIEDTAKLPVWAQHRIAKLEADCEYWKEKVRFVTGDEPTNMYIEPYLGMIPLPRDCVVQFQLGEKWDEKVVARIEKGRIAVMGSGTLTITPRSSSTVELGLTPY